jgi:hypothetical protein
MNLDCTSIAKVIRTDRQKMNRKDVRDAYAVTNSGMHQDEREGMEPESRLALT